MASSDKQNRPKARLAKGFRDVDANEIRGLKRMLRIIEGVYENYGFEPVEQPFIEYTEALGKFLPDQDRPNEGVFSFQDDDELEHLFCPSSNRRSHPASRGPRQLLGRFRIKPVQVRNYLV